MQIYFLKLQGKEDCPGLPDKIIHGVCCLTGIEGDCVERGERIGQAFTNSDLFVAPESSLIGVDAYIALSYKWERMSLWWCDGKEFKRPNRIEVRDMILNGVDAEQWAGYITTSYKKHGALWAKVNSGRYGIWRFEMQDVDCRDILKVTEWYNIMNDAVHNEIGRTVLETLICSAWLIDKIGLKRWMEFEQWARAKYQSALYQFLCYLLPSKEERKNEPERIGISNNQQDLLFSE
jgi:hypothetical protein